jgi:hypothetical protein
MDSIDEVMMSNNTLLPRLFKSCKLHNPPRPGDDRMPPQIASQARVLDRCAVPMEQGAMVKMLLRTGSVLALGPTGY